MRSRTPGCPELPSYSRTFLATVGSGQVHVGRVTHLGALPRNEMSSFETLPGEIDMSEAEKIWAWRDNFDLVAGPHTSVLPAALLGGASQWS